MVIKGKSVTFLGWLLNIPWLALALLWLTYAVFGWFVSESIPFWIDWLIGEYSIFNWHLSESAISLGVQAMGAGLVLLLAIALIAPIRLIRLFFGTWLESDKKAVTSILMWAFIFVLLICWLKQFVRLLVLLSAGILARLNLQTAGYNQWQAFFILAFVSLGGFLCGLLSFNWWGSSF